MKIIFTTFITVFTILSSIAQVGVNTTTPDPSSILDVVSNNKGFLPPRLSCSQREAITNPAEGLTVFDSDLGSLMFFNGIGWVLTREVVSCSANNGIVLDTYTQFGNANSTTLGNSAIIATKNEILANGNSAPVRRRGYITVAVPSDIDFKKAYLEISVSFKGDQFLSPQKLTVSTVETAGFTEANLNWNNSPAVIDSNFIEFDETELVTGEFIRIDISDQILAAKAANQDRLGLLLNPEGAFTLPRINLEFHSKESASTELRPRLVLR